MTLDTLSAALRGPFLSEAVTNADTQMKTLMVQKCPPSYFLLFYEADTQPNLRLILPLLSIDCAACCSAVKCAQKRNAPRGEKTHKNTLIPICIYSSHRDELKNSFLLISWIICSLCINHGAPSERCRRHSVRNSHSDLN